MNQSVKINERVNGICVYFDRDYSSRKVTSKTMTIKELKMDESPWLKCNKGHKYKDIYFKYAPRKRFTSYTLYDKSDMTKSEEVVERICPFCQWQGTDDEVRVYNWLIHHGYHKLLLRYQPVDLPKVPGLRLKYFALVLIDQQEVLLELDNCGLWMSNSKGGDKDVAHKKKKAIIKTCFAISNKIPLIRIRLGQFGMLEQLEKGIIAIKKGEPFFMGSDFDQDYDWLQTKKPVMATNHFRDEKGRMRAPSYIDKDGKTRQSIQWIKSLHLHHQKMYQEFIQLYQLYVPSAAINRKPNNENQSLVMENDLTKMDMTETKDTKVKVEVEELPF